jgi:hypothetical protein
VEKTKYMFMSHERNAGEDRNIRQNKSHGRVAKFTHFGTTLKNQSCIREEIKRSLNSENACYHLVHSVLSSHLSSDQRLKYREL